MADSKLTLDGDFKPGKSGLMRHDLFAAWRRALLADRIVAGPGIKESQSPQGRIFRTDGGGGGGGVAACPMGTLVMSGENQATLDGGAVIAGPGVHLVPPYTLNTAADGTVVLWLAVDFEANTEDGLLLPGIASSSAPTWGEGASYPPQTLPTAAAPSGTAIVPIGTVVKSGGSATLSPAGCGTAVIHHCPGSVTPTRQ